MKVGQFTTDAYGHEGRREAWREAIAAHSIAVEFPETGDEPFWGHLTTVVSFAGVRFARARSRPQTFVENFSEARDTIWLVLLLEGRASVRQGERRVRMRAGDIVCSRTRVAASLSLETDFTALLVDVPPELLNPSLLSPLPSQLVLVPGDKGVGRVFSGMMHSLAEAIDTLDLDEIRPIEIALPEFLLTSLFSEAAEGPLGGAASVRAAILHKILQTVELHLADPALSLAEISRLHGLPVRYVQKLLSATGQGFSSYVRDRRLDRTRADLASPLHQQLSITDICLRWGFNDIAYFSRSFRERFATSPREYRKTAGAAVLAEQGGLQRGSPGTRALHADGPEPDGERLDLSTDEKGPDRAPPSGRGSPDLGPGVHRRLSANRHTVHWGYFSSQATPVMEVDSGDLVTIETLTHQGGCDLERMVSGDPGAEDVFAWTAEYKGVDRRGAGPIQGSIYGRGAGEGFGVQICTGPILVREAQPGDVLEVEILNITPRPSAYPACAGRSYGAQVSSFWGVQYEDLLTQPRPREVVTVFEIEADELGRPYDAAQERWAKALYSYVWRPQTDPSGVIHARNDYPGLPVDVTTIQPVSGVLGGIEIPVRLHFGLIGLAPQASGLVDSVPPMRSGGAIDNWRLGAGARLYLPVEVAGALLSVGGPHATQGDGQVSGGGIDCSLTGLFRLVLHRRPDLGPELADLDYPLIETAEAWIVSGFSHPDYLNELGRVAQSAVYSRSTLDMAMQSAFRQARRFLMASQALSEDEAVTLLSAAVDFGVTQMVNGNKGVHAVIPKSLFKGR